MSEYFSYNRVGRCEVGTSKIAALAASIFFITGCETTTQTPTQVANDVANDVATVGAIPAAQEPSSSGQASSRQTSSGQTIPAAPDRDAILETIDMFFEALASSDARSIEILVAPEAIDVTAYPEEPGRPVRYGRTRDVAAAMRAGDFPKIEEPYWDPVILQRQNLAVVWAPYEVWVNERLAHCGIDVFNMTRHKTSWRIDSIHWTQEPSACEELWPEGRSVLRPGMFTNPE